MAQSFGEVAGALEELLTQGQSGNPVWGIPEVWTDADWERDPWLHVLVRVQKSEPPEVWELVIHHPDEGDWIRPLGCELRRLLPDPVGDWVEGCIDFVRGSVALFCDHAVTPHQPSDWSFLHRHSSCPTSASGQSSPRPDSPKRWPRVPSRASC